MQRTGQRQIRIHSCKQNALRAEKLKIVRNLDISRLSCLYEKSCGAVVFYRSAQGIRILLVKNHNGKYWSFPKGHVEKGENEKETALREIKEETGLSVKIYENYRQISDYCPFGKIKKRVIFFLAETPTDQVHIQHDEIVGGPFSGLPVF